MKKNLLPEGGNFYKACLHVHTTLSDGKLTPEEIKNLYSENGYSIVAFTDHEVIIPHNDLTDENFLAITSYELAINCERDPWTAVVTTHMNFYSKDKDNIIPPVFDESKLWLAHTRDYVTDEMRAKKYSFEYSADCINDIVARAREEGFLVSYNHPVWSIQNYEEYCNYKGFWAVECYNHECAMAGYEDTIQPVDDLLRKGENVLPIATDDSHKRESCCGGFVMVKADKLEYDAVMKALEDGDLYASNGPAIHSLCIEDGILKVECSEAVNVMLSTERRVSKTVIDQAGAVTSADFDLRGYLDETGKLDAERRDKAYVRITVIDREGKRAHSRAYRFNELMD